MCSTKTLNQEVDDPVGTWRVLVGLLGDEVLSVLCGNKSRDSDWMSADTPSSRYPPSFSPRG